MNGLLHEGDDERERNVRRSTSECQSLKVVRPPETCLGYVLSIGLLKKFISGHFL